MSMERNILFLLSKIAVFSFTLSSIEVFVQGLNGPYHVKAKQRDMFETSMSRHLIDTGFHRNIETNLILDDLTMKMLKKRKCQLMLVEKLPPGLLADPFQIKALEEHGSFKVSFSTEVDLESPAHMSEALTLRVYLNPQDSKRLSKHLWIISTLVPVHARYHLPSNNESLTHKSIVILHPSLFSTCASTENISPDYECSCWAIEEQILCSCSNCNSCNSNCFQASWKSLASMF